MSTVEALEAALRFARRLGYGIRQEWFDGRGGGDCQVKGRKYLFLDLAQSPREHLDVVLAALRREPGLEEEDLPEPLRRYWSPTILKFPGRATNER